CRRGDRLHRRRVWHAEEDRHLAEDRAGLVGDHHPRIAAQNLDLAVDQHVEPPGALALDQKRDAGIVSDRRKARAGTMLKNGRHCVTPQVNSELVNSEWWKS